MDTRFRHKLGLRVLSLLLVAAAGVFALGGCGQAAPAAPPSPITLSTADSRVLPPTLTPTTSRLPTPSHVWIPVTRPGEPVVAASTLHARIRDLSADPDIWDEQDVTAGWLMADGAIVITANARGDAATILPHVAIGTPIPEAIAKIGKPIQRDADTYLYIFDTLVLALYGDATVVAAAFWPADEASPVASTIRRLCDALYEYDRLWIRQDGTLLPAVDGGYTLAYFDGTRPFLAVYDRNDPTRWIARYGALREFYWVNAHTFLCMEDKTWRPVCYTFDLHVFWPQPRIHAYPMSDLHLVDSEIMIDMKYASTDNFTGVNLYGDLETVYVPVEVAERLCAAHQALRRDHPHLRLLVYDVFRPKSMQQRMWDLVCGTEYEAILSDPSVWFSNHYIGMAVDATLFDTRTGQVLDMGTAFDSFARIAWPRHETEYLASGQLSREAYENRLLLRSIMEAEGFTQLYFEWWHFDLHLPGGIPAMFKWFE